ncbi:uncharacterized protein CDAR_48251 [Caerostris darwini]|uniref:Uncharacterized protein n=1 Tax=Caerostris darwini TaxID=1538125 RepID=A0AAV4W1K2_9ARAC|nr:uncharacterized protein CDAR_48251 [Caerostris darwini]
MSVLLQLLYLVVCLQTVWPYPIQDDESSLLDNYGMRLAKRPFYPYKDTILSPFGFLDTPRVTQGQRKKAVDSTFIRFGRSSSGESGRTMVSHPGASLLLEDSSPEASPQDSSPELSEIPKINIQQRFLLNHNGCRLANAQELRKALMSDPNCIRAFQKAKKENVNDTFIRFGKREAPAEKEFESENSNEAR